MRPTAMTSPPPPGNHERASLGALSACRWWGSGVLCVATVALGVGALGACDQAPSIGPVESSPAPATLAAALTTDGPALVGRADESGVELQVRRHGGATTAGAEGAEGALGAETELRPVRRMVVRVYVVMPQGEIGPVEEFESIFLPEEVTEDTVPIRLPRSFDRVKTRLEVVLVDDAGAEEKLEIALAPGFADQLEQASCPTFRALRERDPALVTEVSDKAEVAQ